MSTVSEAFELIELISRSPAVYAGTPEAAHGMVVALGAIILRERTGRSLVECARDLGDLIREATEDMHYEHSQAPLLSDERVTPRRVATFKAFSQHSQRFFELLKAKAKDNT